MTDEPGIILGRWALTEASVRQYLAAVDDDLEIYLREGLAPPLALSVYAVGALLKQLALPPGAIHSLQEMEALAPVFIGEEVNGQAMLERPRRRGAMQFTSVSYTLRNEAGREVQRGKTTVLLPAEDGKRN